MAGAGATGVLLISLFILMAAHYRDNRVGALTNKAFIGNRQAKAEPIAAPLKIGEFVTPDTKANRHAILVPGKYPTISEAMEAAVDGDVILVGDGEYHELSLIHI